MAKRYTKNEVVQRLRKEIERNKPLLMFGSGNGLTAKCAEIGGADLIGIYSTAQFRMQGLPSLLAWLPYCNANEELLNLARQILPVVEQTPLIAGVGAHDVSLDMDRFLDSLKDMGFSGVTNEPFAAMYGPYFLEELEKSGIGFAREAALIQKASEKDMATVAWCMSAEQVKEMAKAGADVIGAMIGVTSGGLTGTEKTEDLDDSVDQINAMIEAGLSVNPDIIVLTHGGPLNNVSTAAYSIQHTHAHGYASGSSGERIPTEKAVVEITKQYKDIQI